VWNLGSSSPNFTLEGHEKGINCVDYYHGGDKPYLISGADDRLAKIWDYQVFGPTIFYLNVISDGRFPYSKSKIEFPGIGKKSKSRFYGKLVRRF